MYTILDEKGNKVYQTCVIGFDKLAVEDRRKLAYLAVSDFIDKYVESGARKWQVLYDSSGLE